VFVALLCFALIFVLNRTIIRKRKEKIGKKEIEIEKEKEMKSVECTCRIVSGKR
jgi:hypothetical protein